jgi:hypothetical protein
MRKEDIATISQGDFVHSAHSPATSGSTRLRNTVPAPRSPFRILCERMYESLSGMQIPLKCGRRRNLLGLRVKGHLQHGHLYWTSHSRQEPGERKNLEAGTMRGLSSASFGFPSLSPTRATCCVHLFYFLSCTLFAFLVGHLDAQQPEALQYVTSSPGFDTSAIPTSGMPNMWSRENLRNLGIYLGGCDVTVKPPAPMGDDPCGGTNVSVCPNPRLTVARRR